MSPTQRVNCTNQTLPGKVSLKAADEMCLSFPSIFFFFLLEVKQRYYLLLAFKEEIDLQANDNGHHQ